MARWRGEKWVATRNLHITLRFLGSIDLPGAISAVRTLRVMALDLRAQWPRANWAAMLDTLTAKLVQLFGIPKVEIEQEQFRLARLRIETRSLGAAPGPGL